MPGAPQCVSGQRGAKGDWNGLLDPLDIDLRRYILVCGDITSSIYDALNTEPASSNIGTSRFARKNLFKEVGLSPPDGPPFPYKVTKYVYATTPPNSLNSQFFVRSSVGPDTSTGFLTNFMGLIAVATDEGRDFVGRRNIVVAWRGTSTNVDLLTDLHFHLVPAEGIAPEAKVHQGFLKMYTTPNPLPSREFPSGSARDQVLTEVKRLLEEHKGDDIGITVTGHSLGGAIATLCTIDIAKNVATEVPRHHPITTILFASPRVGDVTFKRIFTDLDGVKLLRISNKNDMIPDLPPKVLGYVDVGDELVVDSKQSPYLKEPVNYHRLQVYLHTLAGTQGSKGGFQLEVERDVALLNRDSDALTDGYHVPAAWWGVSNKGMKQDALGRWFLDDCEDDDDEETAVGCGWCCGTRPLFSRLCPLFFASRENCHIRPSYSDY